MPMDRARVLDAQGRRLSPCDAAKARRLVEWGRAEVVSREPFTIRLTYSVAGLPEHPRPAEQSEPDFGGARLLLHICCGPCATYTVDRLRALNWHVEGLWFNPNIQPFTEHQRRRESLHRYAQQVALPMHWEEGYEMPAFLRAVAGHERFRERCLTCYRLRLERTASVACERGFVAFTSTLLISPYQDQQAIRRIGEELAAQRNLGFYFENFRRGFARHYDMAREAGLYMQRYCGCVYSEWEANDRTAWTNPRRDEQTEPQW